MCNGQGVELTDQRITWMTASILSFVDSHILPDTNIAINYKEKESRKVSSKSTSNRNSKKKRNEYHECFEMPHKVVWLLLSMK